MRLLPAATLVVASALLAGGCCAGAEPTGAVHGRRSAPAFGGVLLLAALPPADAAAGGLSKKTNKKNAKKGRSKGDGGDDGLEMKSNVGASLQQLWRMRPNHETVKQASLVILMVLIVASVRHLQNVAKNPSHEYGAPKDEDGQVLGAARKAKPKDTKATLDPLARKIREALDSGAAGGQFASSTSSLQFRDEDRDSADLSRENLRSLREGLDAACDACGPDGRQRCWWGAECYRKSPDHLKTYSHPVRGSTRRWPPRPLVLDQVYLYIQPA